ncbi:Flp pilus assembly protein TadD [Stenotrophomonas mori]|uniref:Flp pilus assembly protein TadD n=1 Tax=Stenotrophomonas mori TaxID=2871096 RepID=A0ABT0SDV7_9GAMM|nr:Flp pilus assembly protein TadD [Stenotrophomonas mori]MCL7713507.1 Flp pilus assembly protein TadD [Stenotrophomonas mori]
MTRPGTPTAPRMPARRVPPLLPVLLLALPALLAACSHGGNGYRLPPPEPASAPSPQDDRTLHLALIRKMQEQGAYYASLAHIDAFRKRFGETPELRLLEADALRETGSGAAAAPIYRSLVRGPQAAPAWHGLGLIAAAAGDPDEAQLALANAARLDPLEPQYLGDLGFALLQSGHVADARAPLAKAAELAPGDSRAVANLALWALLSGQPAAAEAMMQRAGLSQAVRNEVLRLNSTLRRPPTAAASPSPAAPAAAAAAASDPATPPPPGSMLERFAPAPQRSDEVLP